MENSYLQTAFALHAIYKNKLYRLDNFKNIYDFAKENYTIARGTCNNFINICEKFGVPNENGNIMELSPDYAQYSVSQLAVMLAFPRELLEKCDKTKSVRELKRMRIEYENGLRTTANAQAVGRRIEGDANSKLFFQLFSRRLRSAFCKCIMLSKMLHTAGIDFSFETQKAIDPVVRSTATRCI